MPAAVPCPPSKPISNNAPTIGSALNSGTKRITVNNRAIMYWPDPKAIPKDSCGPASAAARLGLGSSLPRNKVANTMLIKMPGRVAQTDNMSAVNSPLSGPPILPNT